MTPADLTTRDATPLPALLRRLGAVERAQLDAAAPAEATARADDATRPLRILMILECAGGGTGRHVLDLSEGLIARGCEVHVIYSPGRIDPMFLGRLTTVAGLHHAALPMRTSPHPADVRVLRAVRRYMRQFGPFDAVHGHSSKGGAIARLAAVGTGVPAFYTLHGLIMMDPRLSRSKRLFYLGVEIALSLRTRTVIAVSPEEARAAVAIGLGRSRVALIPNGVGPARLTPRADARRALGVADDETVVGFVGRLVDQKAPEVLVQALAAVVEVAPRVRLAMVGAGPLEKPLRELADNLGVADRIIWTGERDARQLFAAFDLFALSSRKEGLPYVILEAMAAGLPVVATSAAGVQILIEPGVNGEVAPPDDPAAFAAALLKVVAAEPERRRRYAQASLDRASAFTIDAMVDRTLAAYRGRLAPYWDAAAPAVRPATADSARSPAASPQRRLQPLAGAKRE